ncbi:MAG: hypothetical protein M3203_04405 [Actinomycetota bacterium]|nr:hypothetical protein [Actinomycetota bacterium]
MDGKVDWMAYGLPVEGEDGPFIGEQASPVPTCDAHGTVADARRALEESGQDQLVVVAAGGLAVGEVDARGLDGHGDDEGLLDVMSPVPSTYRPSVTVASLADNGGGRFLVTTSDGRLFGAVTVEPGGHDHDHGPGDMEKELEEVLAAIEQRFGDRSPSEEELRSFLRDRLVAEGRTPEDADRWLHELG